MNVLLSGSVAVLLLLAACGRHPYTKAVVTEETLPWVWNPVVDPDSSAFYKTHVTIYGKTLSGILGVKNKQDSMLVTFFSEMGAKYFDLILLKDTFRIIDCIPQLRSDAVIRTVVADLKTTFLFEKDQYRQPARYTLNRKTGIRFRVKEDWLFADISADSTVESLTYAYGKRYKVKYTVSYSEYLNKKPQHISVRHSNISLTIDLTRFTIH